MSLQSRWAKTEKWQELAQILELPIVREALAIVEEEAKPNAPHNGKSIQGLCAADASFVLVGRLNISSGMQSAIDRLRALGRPPPTVAPKETAVPFEHIDETNYEKHLSPT